ncbi:MAG: DNA internalization-related competence protein ComEC/Rec2 [Bacteroidota bacterium]
MNERPALRAAAVIILGICSARFIPIDWRISALFATVFLVLSIISYAFHWKLKGRESFLSFFILPLLFFASAASYSVNVHLYGNEHITQYLDSSDTLTIYCTVADQPRVTNGKTTMLVSVTALRNEFDSIRTEGRAYLTIIPIRRSKEVPVQIPYGSLLSFRSIMQSPGRERNPGEFSYRDYLGLNNIHGSITVVGYSNVVVANEREQNVFFEYIIFPSKEFVSKSIRTAMSGDEANFLTGLLLGDRTDLSADIKNAFMNTGTIHVLAVSGSHVVLVAEIIFVVVGLLRFSGKPKYLLAIIFLLYYMYLTGATPSVVRATLMVIVMYLGKIFEERTDVYNVLGVSAVIILLFDPKQLFDVGFQLSFSAVFSIVYFYPKVNVLVPKFPDSVNKFNILTTVWQLFAVSLAAQIGTLPFTAYYFGKVSIVSLFANLIVVPLVEIIVTVGLSGALLGIFSMWIASCFSEVNSVISVITLWFVKWAEQVPYAVVNTATFGFKETIFYSSLIGFLFNMGNRTVQKRFIFGALAAANIFLFLSFTETDEKKLKVTFLDVGQGDGAVIQFPTGETVIVDAGPKTPGVDAGERTVAPFLRRSGISHIDAMITTHPHADHLGGVPYLLKNFSVHATVDAGQSAQSALFRDYDRLEQQCEQITVRAGMILNYGGARLYVLHPTQRFIDSDSTNGYSDLNQSSVVFKLQYGNTSMLFTGDAEIEAEEQLVDCYGDFLRSDLLKAGHHGSSTSSSERFVSVIQPKHAVVSVAKFNKFRHPSKKVLRRFLEHHAVIHRTDEEGAVIVESDGKELHVVGWR